MFTQRSAARALVGHGDDVPFPLRLGQALAWYQARVEAGQSPSLRSDELRPRVLERDRVAVVRGVLSARLTERLVRSAAPVLNSAGLRGGKLLAYFPDAELADGAAEAETGGFFDVNDTPPWDTWVALFTDPDPTHNSPMAEYLVSWVPASLVALVQRGLDVSMVDCIAWLQNTNTSVARRLRDEKFFSN